MTHLTPSPDVLAAHLDGESVLLHVGTKRYFRLNATGAEVWKGLEAGDDADTLVRRLMERFDVSEVQARRESTRFRDALLAAGLLSARTTAPGDGEPA